MSSPKRSPGHRAPLFDRLVDLEPHLAAEVRPARTLDQAQLYRSIAREIERLCNTRSSASLEEIEEFGFTVIHYGIPDLTRFNPRGERDRERLAQLMTQAIAAFEPRLRSPRVEMLRDAERPMRWVLRVRGHVQMENLWEPVSFPLAREDSGSAFVLSVEGEGR